ncbi:N-acetyltransferase [Pedobacter sp. KBW01]|uniref:GNAT family N-acetyltransferase n=1 Tax=Pedobacter sp. KBW01 TaxID=2153364 RepID=UPI000F5990E0|nr:GNAT family N-acetyltransferase [Pedobacter sp. KBW01]RQO69100.1 N-acetyltransferase [Pedobacter sp. KBW01]
MQNITYSPLSLEELNKIAEIDRSENISEVYIYKKGQLLTEQVNETVTAFEPAELAAIIEKQKHLKQGDGEVVGAFINHTLVGVASIENRKRGLRCEYCKMDILYVSNAWRGKKIGQHLVEEIKKVGRNYQAKKLYISATPTKASVDFYLKSGACLTKEIDQELFDLEPLDIHLEMDV